MGFDAQKVIAFLLEFQLFVTAKVSKFIAEGVQNLSVLAALFTLKHLAVKQIFYDNFGRT